MSQDPQAPCPCGTGRPYGDCCRPYHAGDAHAPTAEALMRSRYAAFAVGDAAYLVRTLHPAKRTPGEQKDLAKSLKRTEWVGLIVLRSEGGSVIDTTGTVEFEASWLAAGSKGVMHERSSFVRHEGRWVYVDGAAP